MEFTVTAVSHVMLRIYVLRRIGATTVGTGGHWSPTVYVGGPTYCIVRSPNFLAAVFKKQQISQQVLLLQ